MTNTFPPSLGGGSGGGAADGTNRQYQLSSTSEPADIVQQVIFEADGYGQDTALFPLTAAGTGDELTVFIESAPVTIANFCVLVIPAAFDDGSIRVINRSPMNFFLVTEASLGSPLQPNEGRAPGVSQVLPGTTEFLIATRLTEDGNKLVQVNSLRALVKTTSARSHKFAAPALGASVDFPFPFADYALWLLEFSFPRSVRVYSDQPVECKLEFIAWDATARSFSMVFGEATWTNQATGEPDFGTINIVADLSKFQAGNGMYSMIPPDCIARLTLTAFPGDAPSFVDVAIGVKSLVSDYA